MFQKYPERRTEIIKVVMKYVNVNQTEATKILVGDSIEKKTEAKLEKNGEKALTKVVEAIEEAEVKVEKKEEKRERRQEREEREEVATTGYPLTIANYDNPSFKAIGQTTFDYQRARGSGLQTAASTNSGNFRWNNATVHQGDATGNARQGWATSSSNNYGLGTVNYVNSEQNSGAYGDNAQTNSSSNYYLANNAVWNNGDAWGRAQGKDSLAFSNLNGNSYGYGAVNGDTNTYTDGDLAVSKSQIKGAPYFGN